MSTLSPIEILPFQSESLDEIFNFISLNPWKPFWPADLVRRFLFHLTSSPDLVFDLHREGSRIAVAVLLDRVQNRGNDANLEILGVASGALDDAALREIIRLAQLRLPGNRSGIQVSFHESHLPPAGFCEEFALSPYYEMHKMETRRLEFRAPSVPIFVSRPEHEAELYRVLVESFAENVDANIPSFADWVAGRRESSAFMTFCTSSDGRISGFLNLSLEEAPEIRTVGVLPSFRLGGLGRELIVAALNFVREAGHASCSLTVAAQNSAALGLYRSLGFCEVERFSVFRWGRD